MKENILKDKSFRFSVELIQYCQIFIHKEKQYEIGRQLLRSGTAIGALVREAEHAQSTKDFIHKLSIALNPKYAIENLLQAQISSKSSTYHCVCSSP